MQQTNKIQYDDEDNDYSDDNLNLHWNMDIDQLLTLSYSPNFTIG